MDSLTHKDLLKHVRDALAHLYDGEFLRRSPLAALLGIEHRLDTSAALRNILLDAIESLKPQDGDPSSSRIWQLHDALYCCYVQRLSQQVVADQLAVSPRQLRREQHVALEALTDRLCEQFGLAAKLSEMPPAVQPTTQTALVSEDLAWLKDAPAERPTDLGETLHAALSLVEPLAAQHSVRLDIGPIDGLPSLAAHPVALSQILLSLLGVAIPQAQGRQVLVSARAADWAVKIVVQGERAPTAPRSLSEEDMAGLDLARRLVELCSGQLSLSSEDEAQICFTVTLPALERLPVLVIDDNADALQLFQRYTAGTRYRLIVSQDPEEALSLAEAQSPAVIVLDVMMPQVDGWKVLGRLRQHPRTSHIPVIVCTIVPQEALARSLGASAFVRKPVTRQALLAALDAQIGSPVTAPR